MQRCFSNHIYYNFKLNIVLDYDYNLGIYGLYTNLDMSPQKTIASGGFVLFFCLLPVVYSLKAATQFISVIFLRGDRTTRKQSSAFQPRRALKSSFISGSASPLGVSCSNGYVQNQREAEAHTGGQIRAYQATQTIVALVSTERVDQLRLCMCVDLLGQ